MSDKYYYWEIHFDSLFTLAIANSVPLTSWIHFIDYRALQLWSFLRLLIENKGEKISIDSLGNIPFDTDDCAYIVMLLERNWNNLGYRLTLSDRELVLNEV